MNKVKFLLRIEIFVENKILKNKLICILQNKIYLNVSLVLSHVDIQSTWVLKLPFHKYDLSKSCQILKIGK